MPTNWATVGKLPAKNAHKTLQKLNGYTGIRTAFALSLCEGMTLKECEAISGVEFHTFTLERDASKHSLGAQFITR